MLLPLFVLAGALATPACPCELRADTCGHYACPAEGGVGPCPCVAARRAAAARGPAALTYAAAAAAAKADGRPVVVFVGCPPVAVPGAHLARAADLPGLTAPCVVVGRWGVANGRYGFWQAAVHRAGESPEVIAQTFAPPPPAAAPHVVVRRFVGPNCGPCRLFAPLFDSWQRKFAGRATFVTVDCAADKAAAAKYEVTQWPTVVVEVDGNVVGRLTGLSEMTESRILPYLEP